MIFLRPLSLSAFIFGDYTTTKAQNVLEMADPACACDVSRQLMNCKVSATEVGKPTVNEREMDM